MRERCECRKGASSKFWEIGIAQCGLWIHFGKIGTTGQFIVKDSDASKVYSNDKDVAQAEMRKTREEKEKMVSQKMSEGYVRVEDETPVEKGTILSVEQLETEHTINEAFLVASFLTHSIERKATRKEVESRLRELADKIEECSDFEDEHEWVNALATVFRQFDLKLAIIESKKAYYLEDPQPDEFSELLASNDFGELYQRGVSLDADRFTLYDELNGYVSLVLSRGGPVSAEEVEYYEEVKG